jgi:sirohydrochlorin cobaltochelatase
MADDFSNDALVLIAHGSTVNEQSSAPTRLLVEKLRGRNLFAEVACAFNLEQPKIEDVPRLVSAKRIFIVPVTISEGHFTEETIPFRLTLCTKGQCDCPEGECNYPREKEVGGKQLIYCKPIGTHASMTEVLLARARNIVTQHPFPKEPQPSETTLFIAGHGTKKNANSRKAIEAQVELIRQRGEYADVHAAFMEESPFIADCYTASEAKHIVMVPFFIADGLHTVEDIPVFLGELENRVKERLIAGQPTWRNPTERQGKLVWYTEAIGSEPSLPEVILERVREMAP